MVDRRWEDGGGGGSYQGLIFITAPLRTTAAPSAGVITAVPWAAARQTICLLQMGPGQLGPLCASLLKSQLRLPALDWTGSSCLS